MNWTVIDNPQKLPMYMLKLLGRYTYKTKRSGQ
jgi:hypothetical protein